MSSTFSLWPRKVRAVRSRRRGNRSRALRTCLRPELLEGRSLLSVALGTHFPALDFAQTGVGAPPDTIAAAGPSEVVELVNTNIAVYNKTGGSPIFQQNLSQFFSGVMTGNALSDPFVLYDEQAGRFVIGVLDLSATIFGTISSDRLMIAVSNNNHPTSAADFTEKHSINVTERALFHSGNVWADFPRAGWNADEYVITMNMFGTGFSQTYDHVEIITIAKTDATDANNATFTVTDTDRDGSNFTMVPATMHDAPSGGPMYFVEEAPTSNTIRVVQATGLLTSSPFFTETNIPVAAYTAPPAATQKGSSSLISTNDSRILNAEWRNNRLVAAQSVGGSDGLAHARWSQFNTSGTPALIQQGTIGVGSGSNSYFPAIAIAPDGDLGMSYIESSSNEYMSMYVTGRSASDPLNTMQAPILVQPGVAPLSATFDSSPYRAGDFSGATVDINADGTQANAFWAANEWATGNTSTATNWGTALANFSVTASVPPPDTTPPTVTVTAPSSGANVPAGSTFTIQWSATDNPGGSGVTTIDLYDSTNGGASYTLIAASQPNTGTYSWSVPSTTSNSAIVEVDAHDAAGNIGTGFSGTFNIVSQTTSPVVALDSGGGAVGNFAADTDVSGGSTYSTGDAIDTTGVASPAPQAVYQTERYGNFTYTVPGLTPGASYTVRLHFAEIYWNAAGQRLFNVAINGAPVLSNFDIYATAGGQDKAIVEAFNALADAQGQITIAYTTVRDNAKSSGIEILTAAPTAPAAPGGLAATAGNAQVALSWTPLPNAATYDVYRGTTSGGEGATPYRTGLTSPGFTDTGLTNGTTYYYQVSAVNAAGEGARSAEASATTAAPAVVALDSGGGAVGNFAADTDVSGGSTYSTGDAIDTTGVASPAPQAVYQTERYGNFTYTVPGLTPGASYTVRLHFAEIYWNAAGQRLFNVAINGQQVLTNFDVFAAAGGKDRAIVEPFTATADAQGRITIAYTTVRDNAKSSGIEIIPS